MNTNLRFYKKEAQGRLEEVRDTLLLAQLGGVCPSVGDRIIHEDAELLGQDCNGPESVRIYEVVGRYFKAHGDENQIAIVLQERRAEDAEITLL